MNYIQKINFKKVSYFFVVLAFFVVCLGFIPSVYAQDSVLDGTNGVSYKDKCGECKTQTGASKEACKQYCGEYELNDMVSIIVKVSNIILQVAGALSLLAFVVGGVIFLVSSGNQTMVTRGKTTIIGAVIGLLIVFFSYTIISFITKDVLNVSDGDVFTTGTQ